MAKHWLFAKHLHLTLSFLDWPFLLILILNCFTKSFTRNQALYVVMWRWFYRWNVHTRQLTLATRQYTKPKFHAYFLWVIVPHKNFEIGRVICSTIQQLYMTSYLPQFRTSSSREVNAPPLPPIDKITWLLASS